MNSGPPSVPVVVVTGPTASGKSAVALRLAQSFGGTVINADSMQVYRELRVLTARPTPADEATVRHRLYGIVSAAERCSVGLWRSWAVAEVAGARAEGSVPIVTGGTGLYIKALLEGLSPIPAVPAEARAAVRERLRAYGRDALLSDLAHRDPDTAARIAASDTQRLVRALEVLEGTGRQLSFWQRTAPPAEVPGLRPLSLVIAPPREQIHAACDARFETMIERGALQEVERLDALGLSPDLPAMRAVGVRELRRHLRGEIALAEACGLAQRATRQYAKRQMTWLRHQMTEARWFGSQYSERLSAEIFPIVRDFLLTA